MNIFRTFPDNLTLLSNATERNNVVRCLCQLSHHGDHDRRIRFPEFYVSAGLPLLY